jgi:hypothetical protein
MRGHRHNSTATGRIRKKGGTGNGNDDSSTNQTQPDYKDIPDSRHNGEMPVCRILNEAIEDIFPELKKHPVHNQNENQQQQQQKSLQQNSKQQKQKDQTIIPPQQSVRSTSSTFGQMLRLKFLDLRQSSLAGITNSNNDDIRWEDSDTLVSQFEMKNNNRNSADININSNKSITNGNNLSTATATTTKKKRKRKKKKKQQEVPPLNFPTTISAGSNEIPCSTAETTTTYSTEIKGGGDDNNFNDGKSMMSADHSVEALDEAIKNETEKMIEQKANNQFPLLASLPSDDNIQAEECPSQFLEQIKPQEEEEDSLPFNGIHAEQQQSSTNSYTDNGNHLSIPEDCIPNKEDSAGNVWKSPLQHSFLVTAHGRKGEAISDNGCVRHDNNSDSTSTVYISEDVNREQNTSDKETTRILFHEWIDQFFILDGKIQYSKSAITKKQNAKSKDHTEDWDSFFEFCNQCTMGKEKALGISFQDLKDIASSIQCQSCREDTLSEIKKLVEKAKGTASSTRTSSRIVMKSSLLEKPYSSLGKEVDIDSAFDYVALEEGNHIPLNHYTGSTGDVDEYNCSDEEILKTNLSFVVADSLVDSNKSTGKRSTNNNKKNFINNIPATEQYLFLQEISSSQMDDFLYECLIAGVDEESLVQMSVREEDEFGNNSAITEESNEEDNDRITCSVVTSDMIKNKVTETQQNFIRSLEDLEVGMQNLKQEWRSDETELNLDYKRVGIIKNCEESCDMYFTENILAILTGQLSLPFHACADIQIHLWAVYLGALGETFNACDKYYKILEEDLADQNGKVPIIFICAPLRLLYRNFARDKINAISDVMKSFAQALNNPKMKEFYTRLSWHRRKPDDQCKESNQLDDGCRKLIQVLTEWTKIIQGGRMSTINKERLKRLECVFDILRVVVVSLGKEYDKVDKNFSKEQQDYFTSLLSNIHLANGVKSRMRLIEKEDVVSLAFGVILMWRHVRIMQSRVAASFSLESLPLSLHQWMLQPLRMNIENDGWFQGYSKCCPGVGGRRRVMGMLAGLAYVWLRERCNEWKAEKSRQELLTDFDLELSSSTDQQLAKQPGAKSNKKNKKKKNKLGSSVPNRPEDNTVVKNIARQELTNDLSKNDKKYKNGNINEIAVVGNVSDADDFEFVNGESSGKKIDLENDHEDASIAAETTRNISNDNVGDSSHLEQGIEKNIESYEASVLVQDESGCSISAADFLTDRLLSLMNESESKNIVIIPI